MARLRQWAMSSASRITSNRRRVSAALDAAANEQSHFKTGYDDQGYPIKVALADIHTIYTIPSSI